MASVKASISQHSSCAQYLPSTQRAAREAPISAHQLQSANSVFILICSTMPDGLNASYMPHLGIILQLLRLFSIIMKRLCLFQEPRPFWCVCMLLLQTRNWLFQHMISLHCLCWFPLLSSIHKRLGWSHVSLTVAVEKQLTQTAGWRTSQERRHPCETKNEYRRCKGRDTWY